MRTTIWVVPAFHCRHCLSHITKTLRDIKGIRLLGGDPIRHTLIVEGTSPEVLAYTKRCLAQAGYPVQPCPRSPFAE